jgi:sensor histidine kinase/response regulator
MDLYPALNLLFGKLFLMSLILWQSILLVYIYVVSINDKENVSTNVQRSVIVSMIICFISCIIIIILPLNFSRGTDYVFSSGPAALFTYGVCAVFIILLASRIFIRFKYLKKKKYTPILLYILMIIIGTLIQLNYPQFLVVSTVTTFITCLMYFTIENPDVKMIEKLNILKNQADKANMAKSEFLSSMSHEIRTPLNAIVGFSESLKEESLSKEAMEEVDDIISASSTLLEIVNGILDISKIEANKIEIVDNEYDISKVLKELVNLTKVKIGAKPIDLKVNIAKDLPQYLYGDQLRVKQVILNLLTNAAKYTDSGVINFDVTSVIANDSCRLIISVKDTGRGIKKENIDKLFTKFERLDEENSTIEGTGLGLAITKKLVTMMGGKIVVKSEYQKGSDFIVAIDQKIVANPTIKEENEIALNKSLSTYKDKKILLVDDNNMNLKVAKRLLQIYEVQIDTCDNGNDTINKIKNNENYDLILLDDMMPGKSGCETLKELKEIPNFKIPVVVLTANAIEGMKEKYLDAGFDDYLAKPIAKDELKRILAKFLN